MSLFVHSTHFTCDISLIKSKFRSGGPTLGSSGTLIFSVSSLWMHNGLLTFLTSVLSSVISLELMMQAESGFRFDFRELSF